MEKIFFLSHSTKDEEIIKQIAALLGKERCWLYQWEVKPGDSIFKFDRGISDSRIFVLFWSKNAASSQWVEEETSQARIHLSRDKGFRFIVVKLDTTPLPDSLAYRLYIDGSKGERFIVEKLQFIENDLTLEEVYIGKPILKDSFQNRQGELDRLEFFSYSKDHSGIIVLGPDGIGKTSLVKRSIAHLFSHLIPIWVDLKIASTPIRLLSAISKPLSITIDIDYAATEPIKVWQSKLLPEIAQSDKIFIVFDNVRMESVFPASEGRTYINLVNNICRDLVELYKPENPNLIIISWTLPNFDPMTLAKFGRLELGGLDEKFMVRALRFHLSHTAYMEYKLEKLELLSKELKRYPLAINLAAMMVAERGIDAVIEDTSGIRRIFSGLAQELFSRLSIAPEERIPLIVLATSLYPLNDNHLRSIIGQN